MLEYFAEGSCKAWGVNQSLILASADILLLMQSPPASRGPLQNTDTVMPW